MASAEIDVEAVVTELHQKLKAEDGFKIFKRTIKDKNVIVVLGCTRCGKSTLVNYLIGTPLVSQKHSKRVYKIIKRNKTDEGPEIGVGVVSCTKIPQVYAFEESLLIDLPGFDDNRGEIQDIVNAIYISQIKHAAKVKCVMVYDLNLLLSDNVNQFIDFLDQIHTLFKNFEQLKDSVVIVFSKDSQDFSLDEVVQILRTQLLYDDSLLVNVELIRHLVDTMVRLAIFKAPEDLGDITSLVDYNIKEAISACPWSNLSKTDIEISVSLKSRKYLQIIYNKYLSEDFFYDQIDKEVDKFRNLLDVSDYISSSTATELVNFKDSINKVLCQWKFKKVFNYCNLQDIAVQIKEILNPINADFKRQLEVLADLDNLFLMNNILRGQFIQHYKRSLERAIKQFQPLPERISSEQNSRVEDQKTLKLLGTVTAASGALTVASTALRVASIFPVVSLIGAGVSLAATAGFGTPTLMKYSKIKESNEKRVAARRRQNRWASDGMFD